LNVLLSPLGFAATGCPRRRPKVTNWPNFVLGPTTALPPIALKNPSRRRGRMVVAAAIDAVELRSFASNGEDWRGKGDELRQLPQILGGGCQEELVFRSARSAQAQLIEPEDALQVSEEHLDLLSLPA